LTKKQGVVNVVESYKPVLAMLLAKGIVASDCFNIPTDNDHTFEQLKSKTGRDRLSSVVGKPIGCIDWEHFEKQQRLIETHGVRVVTFLDPKYPTYLRLIGKSPPILFYRGDVTSLAPRGVAIVGSRSATVRGCAFSSRLAGELTQHGVMVASGAARGIDAAAHRGALENNGRTVAVVGTGLDVPYPPEHARLFELIAERGCVITEQVMGTTPKRFVFPLRNRLISAVSHAVVVVEAGERSGALLTARWALEQGREVGAVPGFPGDFRSRGVNKLLKQGAFPVEGVRDVLEAVPLLDTPSGRVCRDTRDGRDSSALSPDARTIMEALGAEPTDTDAVANHLGLPVEVVQRSLVDLEVRGLVTRDLSGAYYKS
jgi:DNA processing protein